MFIPVANALVGPIVAMPLLMMIDAAMSGPIYAHAFRNCDWLQVKRIAIGAVVAFPIGAHLLIATDPIVVRWVASVLILVSLVLLTSGWRYRGPQTPALCGGVGALSGFLSGFAQIGGPPVVVFWLGSGMPAAKVRANLITYFAILIAVGLTIFAWKGLLTANVLWLAVVAAPCFALGIFVGSLLFPLASEVTFRRIAMVLIAFSAISGIPALDPWLRGH